MSLQTSMNAPSEIAVSFQGAVIAESGMGPRAFNVANLLGWSGWTFRPLRLIRAAIAPTGGSR